MRQTDPADLFSHASNLPRKGRHNILRDVRTKLRPLVHRGVAEGQSRRVQTQARVWLARVESVADNRVTHVRAVYAKLVRAARHGLKLDERARPASLDHAQARLGTLARLLDPPLRKRLFVAAYGRVDRELFLLDAARDDSRVSLLDQTTLEVLRQAAERGLCLRNDQKPRGVAVETVDEAGAYERLRISVEVIGERVGERAALDAARGVYELARGLDDDDYLLVLVNYFERRALGRHRVQDLARVADLHSVSRAQTQTRARQRAVDRTRAAREQRRDVHAAQSRDALREKVVEPLPLRLLADLKLSLRLRQIRFS